MSHSYHKLILGLIILAIALAHPHPNASCPVPQSYLTLHHGHLNIAQGAAVALTNGVDALCYNYPLPAPFQNRPGVAIAVRRLEANPSADLFFSIHSVRSDSLGALSFLIRTQWRYTQWNNFQVSFLAEDHPHFDANSFSIDTPSLAGCTQSKEVKVILPYSNANFQGANSVAFLHGFEISTAGIQVGPSPYQVQVYNLGTTTGGVALRITSTTATKIFSVLVSIIGWSTQAQNVVGSTYQYTSFAPTNTLSTSTLSPVSENTIDIYGLSGFIINKGAFVINTSFNNVNQFTFTTATTFQFFGFSYFFISTPLCSECQGYPLHYNGVCYANCPAGTYLQNGKCITCPQGQVWNGTACISNGPQCPTGTSWNGSACVFQPQCPQGQVWNGSACVSNGPQCPTGTSWNGSACVFQPQCPQGQVWNGSACVSNGPQCPTGTSWNGSACVFQPQCPQGQVWNGSACIPNVICPSGFVWNGSSCQPSSQQCPAGTFWNGFGCINQPVCPSGLVWNGSTCVGSGNVCPQGSNWNGSTCISCSNGQIWSSTSLSCACPTGQFWNGYTCISCPVGQFYNQQTNQCSCPLGQNWNGFSCISCQNGRLWNQTLNACACPFGLNWNGVQCISCNSDEYWNGYLCVKCFGGQVWNAISSVCECPTGYQWNGTQCIVPCPPGQISVGGICQCPAGTFLVGNVCQPQPSCPTNQLWNGSACVPISCPIGYFWNGTQCTVQILNCPAGTYWDGFSCIAITNSCPPGTIWNGQFCATNTTQCPSGSYWNGFSCSVIPSQCPPGMHWVNGQCIPIGNSCPPGTFFNGQACIPVASCTDGKVWNQTLTQCVCPLDSFWNGNKCIGCGGGQTFDGSGRCFCPLGLFWDGSKCTAVNSSCCFSMQNSNWIGGRCQCLPGFIPEGKACICNGLSSKGYCDRCYLKPNSQWRFGICQCKQGYYEIKGSCVRNVPKPPSLPFNPICNVATYFDNQEKVCLPCSDGCLSCTSCYACTQCRPQYNYNPISQLCKEICGDGKRFTLACDDGNNINGDGCSSDCRIQTGYHCVGGSPNSKDTCSAFKPSALVITQSGQTHIPNKIIINVRLNYMPQELLNSAVDCKDSCNSVLDVKVISGDRSFISIVAKYIPTSSYSFSIEIDFGREPIGLFTAQVAVQVGIALKYFSGIDTSFKLSVNVNPAFLSVYTGGSKEKNDLLE